MHGGWSDRFLTRHALPPRTTGTTRDEVTAAKLIDVLGPRYKGRSGGYLRVLKAGFRYGDSAPRAVIELVDRDESAAAVPHIRDKLAARGINVPLIGDFHYIGHKLLGENPDCAEALDKYRINPGNVGKGDKQRMVVRAKYSDGTDRDAVDGRDRRQCISSA